jgi:hypothetical protein
MFDSEKLSDGYFQRISRIDQEVLEDYYRIYLHIQEDYTSELKDKTIFIHEIDDAHMEIDIDHSFIFNQLFSYFLIMFAKRIYVHSVLRVIRRSTGEGIRRAIKNKNVYSIWDVHGAAPEEFAMYEDYWGAQEAGEAESFLVKYANSIVCVTNSMIEHLQSKYCFEDIQNMICYPIISEVNASYDCTLKDDYYPTCIYAGGVQKWQKPEAILDCIFANPAFHYKLYTNEPVFFEKKFDGIKNALNVEIGTKTHDELETEYCKCHLGFALRDDSIVNIVACPTKIVEYIQHGIVPILDCTDIGDFRKMGLQYIQYRDFINGNIIKKETAYKMAEDNSHILKRINESHRKGLIEIRDRLGRDSAIRRKVRESNYSQKTAVFLSCKKNSDSNINVQKWIKEDVVILTDSYDFIKVLGDAGLNNVYCISPTYIRGKKYGGTKRELVNFLKRFSIKTILNNSIDYKIDSFCSLMSIV